MRSEALIKNHADSESSHEFRAPNGEKSFEIQAEEVESRLQRVCDRYKNLNAAPHFVWLEDGAHIYDPGLNLRVKVDAVRWMLRIAKHMSEAPREVVFSRIENSLRQLESAVESRARSATPGSRTERIHLVPSLHSSE